MIDFCTNPSPTSTASVHTSSQHTGVHRIDIFGTSSYRSVLHWVYQDDVLSAKEDLGGYLTSAPAAVVWTSTLNGTTTVISVFGRNARNSISYRSFYRGTWTPWIDLGGVNFSSGPAVTSDGPNDIEMVARGSDNQIYMKNFSNSMWGNWFSLGGVNFTSAPAIASYCRLTHKFAKGGRYASEDENGEDMRQRGMTTISAKRAISARRTFFTSQVLHEANYLVEEGPTSQLWAGLRGSSIVPT